MTSYRVCIVPEYPSSLMTGGLQVQAEETFRALLDRGVQAELFNWQTSTQADLYHFVGFPAYLGTLARLIRQADKPYVCTLLFGGQYSPLGIWMARLRHHMNACLPGRHEYREALVGAKAIITLTQTDRTVAQDIFGIPANRIVVVENGVDERFRTASATLWRKQHGDTPFVLCVGHIQRRKNQRFLLQAANQLHCPVVLIGSILPGEDDYARLVEQELRINATYGGMWVRDVPANSPILISAYAACRAYALLSHHETQPLSVLEAMAAGKPVLLADAGYAREAPFSSLPRTSPSHLDTAIRDLQLAWKQGPPTELPASFSWPHVAEKLTAVYESALSRLAETPL